MYQTKEKEIDGFKIIVTQWPARKAFKKKLMLIRIFGPSLSEIVGGSKAGKETGGVVEAGSAEIDIAKVGSAIGMLFTKINEDEMLELILKMFSLTKVDNKEITETEFDMMFAGKLSTVYKIIGFILEVNYGSFFGKGGIGTVMNKLNKIQ